MPARSAFHALIVLLAVVASEPFHEWIHGEHGVEHSGQQEIHDGSCEHFPEHHGGDDCLLCIKGHGQAIVLVPNGATLGELSPAHRQAHDVDVAGARDPRLGLHGARAPPVLG